MVFINKRFYLIFATFFLVLSSVFSYNFIFDDSILNLRDYKADIYTCTPDYLTCTQHALNVPVNPNKNLVFNGLVPENSYLIVYKYFDNSIWYSNLDSYTGPDTNTYYSSGFPHYINDKLSYLRGPSFGDPLSQISSPLCQFTTMSYSGTSLDIYSNIIPAGDVYLQRLQELGYFPEHRYMKTELRAKLHKVGNPTAIASIPVDGAILGTGNYVGKNYVLVQPSMNTFTFTLPSDTEIYTSFGTGDYYWNFTANPIDSKCDFNGMYGVEEGIEAQSAWFQGDIFPVTVPPPTHCTYINPETADQISIPLGSKTPALFDPNPVPTTADCISFQYVCTNPNGALEFSLTAGGAQTDISNLITSCNIADPNVVTGDVTQSTNPDDRDGDNIPNQFDNCPNIPGYKIYQGCKELYTIGRLGCTGVTFDRATKVLTCTEKYGLLNDVANEIKFSTKSSGDVGQVIQTGSKSIHLLNYNIKQSGFYNFIFDSATGNNHYLGTCHVSYNGPEDGALYNDLSIRTDQKVADTNYERNIFIFDPITNITKYVDQDKNPNPTTLPITDQTKFIKVYKNNVNILNETINPELIALRAHKLESLNNQVEAETFVQNSYELMKRLDIEKHIDNSSGTSSRIKIKLTVPEADQINLTVYQVLSKDITYDQITRINDAGAQLITIEKDPIIGWYFNDSDATEEIEIEIPGESDGGTIIITQEPILFNEGELIVNYRESGCNPDEAHLFDLEDLTDSKVLDRNAGIYQVCLAHITEILQETIGPNTLEIGSYNGGGQFRNSNTLSNLVTVSTDNMGVYWDLLIQKNNPDGTYSCLGSVDDKDASSSFGDCGFNQNNRIWLHLGDDLVPPTTKLVYPFMAHTLRVSFEVEENTGGSGIDKTMYCIKNTTNTCAADSDFKQYQDKPFIITCDNAWGCVKEVFFYSADKKGNKEPLRKEVLTILDEGSACQADCMAKPSPNRYIRGCNNLNGCNFYKFDKTGLFDEGKYVAGQCDLHIEDSWVKYNTTHEIMCPKGPFRESRFTLQKLFFYDSLCDSFQVIPYTVLIDGEQVTMKIVHCNNI